MQDVMRTRLPLCICAGILAADIFVVFGGGGTVQAVEKINADPDPKGLFQLLALVVVVISALKGRHFIESLTYGCITAALIGFAIDTLTLGQIFGFSAESGGSPGLIQDGITGCIDAIIFTILILSVTQILIEGGVMHRILEAVQRVAIKTVRQAEFLIIAVSIAVSIPLSINATVALLIGPSLVRPIGKKFDLTPERRANLIDCAVSSLFYTLPWHVDVAVWSGAVSHAAEKYGFPDPGATVALFNPYSWTILAVIIFSAVTGWNRKSAIISGAERKSLDKAAGTPTERNVSSSKAEGKNLSR